MRSTSAPSQQEAVSTPSTPRRFPRWARRLVGVLLLLTLLECGARVLWSEQDALFNPALRFLQDDYVRFWKLRPGAYPELKLVISAQGIRDGSPVGARQPDEKRLLILGEDGAFGLGIPLEKTFGKVLEQSLNAQASGTAGGMPGAGPDPGASPGASPGGVHWRVINASVPGYSSWQSALYLEDQGLAFEPDLVLLYHQQVDVMPLPQGDRSHFLFLQDTTDIKLYLQRLDLSLLMSPLLHSRALLMLRRSVLEKRAVGLATSTSPSDGEADVARPQKGGLPPARLTRADRLMALERIRSVCELHGIPLVIVKPVYRQPVFEDDLLESVAHQHKLRFIDLPEQRYLGPWPETPPLFADALNPTAEGHWYIGQALFRLFGGTDAKSEGPPQ